MTEGLFRRAAGAMAPSSAGGGMVGAALKALGIKPEELIAMAQEVVGAVREIRDRLNGIDAKLAELAALRGELATQRLELAELRAVVINTAPDAMRQLQDAASYRAAVEDRTDAR